MPLLVTDAKFRAAVSNIEPRADRETDDEILSRAFVDTGILSQLANTNSQILYGRRGTGKSHVLRVLGLQIEKTAPGTTPHIDLRVLGSAGLMTELRRPLADRSVAVFKDILSLIQGQLMDIATRPGADGAGFQEFSEFEDVIRAKSVLAAERDVSHRSKITTDSGLKAGLNGSGMPSVKVRLADGNEDEKMINHTEALRDTVVFAEVAQQLDAALNALGIANLFILIEGCWLQLGTVEGPLAG